MFLLYSADISDWREFENGYQEMPNTIDQKILIQQIDKKAFFEFLKKNYSHQPNRFLKHISCFKNCKTEIPGMSHIFDKLGNGNQEILGTGYGVKNLLQISINNNQVNDDCRNQLDIIRQNLADIIEEFNKVQNNK